MTPERYAPLSEALNVLSGDRFSGEYKSGEGDEKDLSDASN